MMVREEKPYFVLLLNRLTDQVLHFLDIKIALFKAELREESAGFLKWLVSIVLFMFVAAIGCVLIALSLVLSLNRYVHNLPLSFLLVGSAFLIA
ncbi:MAG TPA: phage holin family protein, partial [Terriglobia bacterium]|nr:phage holin family protein [Terriglobia bacterium]